MLLDLHAVRNGLVVLTHPVPAVKQRSLSGTPKSGHAVRTIMFPFPLLQTRMSADRVASTDGYNALSANLSFIFSEFPGGGKLPTVVLGR
jgi:hypothetical protein